MLKRMNSLEKINQQIAPDRARLNSLIDDTLLSSNDLLNHVIKTYLRTKGKQIRPILVILSARLFGSVNDTVITAAAAVELLHNATLIHDDVIDDTKMRRNKPTINGIWDNHIAVLTGDFFVSAALQLAVTTQDIRIVNSLAGLGKVLSLGEIDQIFNARFHRLTEEAYFNVIDHKTASLFVSCVEMGAFASGCDDSRLEALREFAKDLGRCFQIRDDIFDYYSVTEIGKPTGNDLREGKITLPLLHVLETQKGEHNDKMIELSRKEILETEEIEQLINYAIENGGIDYARSVMQRLRNRAVTRLKAAFGSSTEVGNFVELIDFAISREM